MFSPLEQFDAIKLISFYVDLGFIPAFEISIFNIIVPFFLVILFFITYLFLLKQIFTIIPNTVQCLFESVIVFIFNLIKQQLVKKVIYIFLLFLHYFNLYYLIIY